MIHTLRNNPIYMGVVYIVLTALTLYTIYALGNIIIYFLLSSLLYIITKPLATKLMKFETSTGKHIPQVLIAMLIMASLGILIYLLIIQILPIIISESIKITQVLENLFTEDSLADVSRVVREWLATKGIQFELSNMMNQLLSDFKFSKLSEYFNQLISSLSGIGTAIFAITFITFFLLKEPNLTTNLIQRTVDTDLFTRLMQINQKVEQMLRRYLLGLVLQISLLMFYYWILLLSFDVPNAFVIAFIAGLFNLVPYLGPLFGAASIFILGLSSLIDLELQGEILTHMFTVSKALIGFLIIQLVDAMISQPLIYSNSVKAHPLEVFLVIMSAGTLAGPLGMIIAVPTYTIIRIVVKEFLNFRLSKKTN